MLAITPADAHAITMVVILAFALGSLVTMFLIMVHNGKKGADAMELPGEEDEEDFKKPERPARAAQEPKASREDWEQDEDWWKK